MASTYVAGGDLEYGRYGNPTWTAFEDALGAWRAALPSVRLRPSPRWRPCSTSSAPTAWWWPPAPYNGTIMQLRDLESRGRLRTTTWSTSPTPRPSWPPVRTPPGLAGVADQPGPWRSRTSRPSGRRARRGAYVVVDNTLATPLLQRPLEQDVDLVVHSGRSTSPATATSDGRVVTRDDELYAVLKGRRTCSVRSQGLEALGYRSAACAPAPAGRARGRPMPRARTTFAGQPAGGGALPGFGGISAIALSPGELAADLLAAEAEPWVSPAPGGVVSPLERRRRWKSEASILPTPCGLVGSRGSLHKRSPRATLLDLVKGRRRDRRRVAPCSGADRVSSVLLRCVSRRAYLNEVIMSSAVIGRRRLVHAAAAVTTPPDRAGPAPGATAGLGALGDLPGGGVDLLGGHAPAQLSPKVRLRDSGEEQVATRSPRPARPISVSGLAPRRSRAGRSRPGRG